MYIRNAHARGSLLETDMSAVKAGATEIRGRRKERGKKKSFKCEILAELSSACSPPLAALHSLAAPSRAGATRYTSVTTQLPSA